MVSCHKRGKYQEVFHKEDTRQFVKRRKIVEDCQINNKDQWFFKRKEKLINL